MVSSCNFFNAFFGSAIPRNGEGEGRACSMGAAALRIRLSYMRRSLYQVSYLPCYMYFSLGTTCPSICNTITTVNVFIGRRSFTSLNQVQTHKRFSLLSEIFVPCLSPSEGMCIFIPHQSLQTGSCLRLAFRFRHRARFHLAVRRAQNMFAIAFWICLTLRTWKAEDVSGRLEELGELGCGYKTGYSNNTVAAWNFTPWSDSWLTNWYVFPFCLPGCVFHFWAGSADGGKHSRGIDNLFTGSMFAAQVALLSEVIIITEFVKNKW